jgi:hypothetical protein
MSTIKVNKLEQRSGCTATVGGGAGKTVTLDATTVTLGRCGGTVSLASGATQSGFGRTGTVNWCTTAKTSPLTVASGNGYFINTTGGAITVTLPSSPSAGDIVAIKDYAGTFNSNAVTLGRNGSKINGSCACGSLSTQAMSVTLIYVDGTKGWQDVNDSTQNVTGDAFISASGGTVTTVCTNYKVHVFDADSTFVVTSGSGVKAEVSYMVVAGGGSGGTGCATSVWGGAGGGAGGYREAKVNTTSNPDSFTASPLAATSGVIFTPGVYPISVGAGGAVATVVPGYNGNSNSGTNSVMSSIVSAGGGGGGSRVGQPANPNLSPGSGKDGGSGGGRASDDGTTPVAGSGNTPPVNPAQGQNGGATQNSSSGTGGGAAGAVGGDSPPDRGGDGGAGVATSITSSPLSFSGGGGGGGNSSSGGNSSGGTGGGAAGKGGSTSCQGADGSTNTGGGGGGGSGRTPGNQGGNGGAGGSGKVIIRYKFQ